jgi:Icc-related predicted phosphoesterase
MIIDCIADCHGNYPELEGGDLLIVGGDWTAHDHYEELEDFEKNWLRFQEYKKIVYIAGNHDMFAQECGWVSRSQRVTYLCDSGTEFEGQKIWGSPWAPTFDGINPLCTAFTGDEELLASKFALIPDDTDILVTHGPPYCILDSVRKRHNNKFQNVGSSSLLDAVIRIRPKLHVYGHIHEGYGQIQGTDTLFINCSHVNEHYEPVNKPIRIIL